MLDDSLAVTLFGENMHIFCKSYTVFVKLCTHTYKEGEPYMGLESGCGTDNLICFCKCSPLITVRCQTRYTDWRRKGRKIKKKEENGRGRKGGKERQGNKRKE
jgi:hypothetical protein